MLCGHRVCNVSLYGVLFLLSMFILLVICTSTVCCGDVVDVMMLCYCMVCCDLADIVLW